MFFMTDFFVLYWTETLMIGKCKSQAKICMYSQTTVQVMDATSAIFQSVIFLTALSSSLIIKLLFRIKDLLVCFFALLSLLKDKIFINLLEEFCVVMLHSG